MVENLHVFLGVLVFIAITVGSPIFYMWSSGKFVGQKPAPKRAKAAILAVATLGIGYSTLLAVQQTGFDDLLSLLLAALVAGSGITGIVALHESFEGEPKGPAA